MFDNMLCLITDHHPQSIFFLHHPSSFLFPYHIIGNNIDTSLVLSYLSLRYTHGGSTKEEGRRGLFSSPLLLFCGCWLFEFVVHFSSNISAYGTLPTLTKVQPVRYSLQQRGSKRSLSEEVFRRSRRHRRSKGNLEFQNPKISYLLLIDCCS